MASRSRIRCPVLREVGDLVGSEGGEAYGNYELWTENDEKIINELIDALPFLDREIS